MRVWSGGVVASTSLELADSLVDLTACQCRQVTSFQVGCPLGEPHSGGEARWPGVLPADQLVGVLGWGSVAGVSSVRWWRSRQAASWARVSSMGGGAGGVGGPCAEPPGEPGGRVGVELAGEALRCAGRSRRSAGRLVGMHTVTGERLGPARLDAGRGRRRWSASQRCSASRVSGDGFGVVDRLELCPGQGAVRRWRRRLATNRTSAVPCVSSRSTTVPTLSQSSARTRRPRRDDAGVATARS